MGKLIPFLFIALDGKSAVAHLRLRIPGHKLRGSWFSFRWSPVRIVIGSHGLIATVFYFKNYATGIQRQHGMPGSCGHLQHRTGFPYVIKRLLGLIPTLFIVSVLVFLFVHMLPGDPARLIAGPEADAQVIELVRQQLGLDQPLYHQFWHYISNAVQGDFGLAMVSRRPVGDEIASRFMPTLWLTITSMVWAVIFGMAAGIIAAVWRNRWPDRLSMTIAVSGISFPAFALGMLLIQVFSVELGWLPTVGADSWQHYILPTLTLGAAVAAVMARFTRASFVDVLSEDYMRTARAKGVSETWVVLKHGLRNAMIPVVTMMGLQFGFLLGGSIVVEKVFNWPGLGRLLVDSVEMRDYPVIQAEILLFSLEFILINLVVDVLYAAINPAIRYK